MPRRPTARTKVEQLSSGPPNPFKTILSDNNNKELRADTGVLNGLDSPEKIHHDVDPCHKYLHKKFKKVATLEQVSPPNGKRIADEKPDEEEKEKVPPTSGHARYVCPYCKLACPKPSVLQKHIRAHTNERPFPCRPCGFAFKTKSNLYKHCRSRAHTLKMDADSPSEEDDDKDKGSSTEPKRIYKPKFHTLSEHDDSGESESDKAEYPSKLALALLRPDEPPQPLNLVTKKDTTHTIDGSIIKDILLRARSGLKDLVDVELETKRHSPSPACEAHKVRLFGGEVHVLDNECRPVRVDVDPNPILPPEVVMISKPGHHSVGRTTISAETPSPPPFGKLVVPMAPISVAGVSSVPFPPVNGITAFNPLTLPDGLVTVVHGGRAIPHVPGMPGPNTLEPLAPPPLILPPKLPPPTSEEPPAKKARVAEEFIPHTNDASQLLKLDMPDEIRTEKKFVRPTSLPLKTGGTYVSKKPACGPAAASLISPETPRPRKSYGQLYLNGHAYTYLGLKCSTRMFFCTLNKPQPIYLPLLPQHAKLSMYSNWKVCSETVLSPVGISPSDAMSSYDSRNRNCHYTTASKGSSGDYMAHSSYASLQKEACKEQLPSPTQKKDPVPEETDRKTRIKVCDGGYESNEDYVYVRGRGRGRYVCEECGIRCKKPSMLKKHIRTHTDVRPYTCKYCAFSFKTKGNLTKHMKSKSHYKRCVELDISPVPTTVEESNINREMLAKQEALRAERGADITQSSEESDEEEESDDDDEDETDEDAGQSLEREAAASLLSLSEVAIKSTLDGYARLGLLSPSVRPTTYPYTLTKLPERSIPRDSALADTPITPPLVPDRVASPSLPTPSDASCPIDLSNKPSGGTEPPASAAMIATIVSTTERVASTATPDPVEESRLLDRYLREKAAWESQLRRHDTPAPPLPPPPIPPSVPREKESDSELRQPARESALGILALTSSQAAQGRIQKPVPLSPIPAMTLQPSPTKATQPTSTPPKPKAEFMPPTSNNFLNVSEDGKSVCGICQKVFSRPSQLMLHVNIHYFERPFRCDACAVSFRTNGHLQKHQRSLSHLNKVNMNSTFGTATTTNPRPFKCDDCKIAFRIHGHLAKHLRSKMHIMRLECVGKLPFGLYAELERSGVSMNDIDTTDCENSLESLQLLAQKMHEKDPTKLGQWAPPEVTSSNSNSQMNMASCGETSSDEDEPKAGEKRLDVPRESALLLPPPPAS